MNDECRVMNVIRVEALRLSVEVKKAHRTTREIIHDAVMFEEYLNNAIQDPEKTAPSQENSSNRQDCARRKPT